MRKNFMLFLLVVAGLTMGCEKKKDVAPLNFMGPLDFNYGGWDVSITPIGGGGDSGVTFFVRHPQALAKGRFFHSGRMRIEARRDDPRIPSKVGDFIFDYNKREGSFVMGGETHIPYEEEGLERVIPKLRKFFEAKYFLREEFILQLMKVLNVGGVYILDPVLPEFDYKTRAAQEDREIPPL